MPEAKLPVSEGQFALNAIMWPPGQSEEETEDLLTVLQEIATERWRQDCHWGGPAHDDTHTPYEWERLLHERVYHLTDCVGEAQARYRRALVEIAALAVAAMQAWDRSHPAEDGR